MVFQDPYSSLNPRMTVGQTLGELLRFHRVVPRNQVRERIRELLDLVGLPPARSTGCRVSSPAASDSASGSPGRSPSNRRC